MRTTRELVLIEIMKYISVKLTTLLIIVGAFSIISCDKDDDIEDSVLQSKPSKSNLSAPTYDMNLTTTTTSDVSIRCRFKNGGDELGNMRCSVHWRSYSSKPSTTPKVSDMTNEENMRIYASTKTKTTFDKTHSGFGSGRYIYYYFECSNSEYTTKTSVTYCLVKR